MKNKKCNCGCGEYLIEEERFWQKVYKRTGDECWNWKAGKDKDGYGRFTLMTRKIVRAHRYSYELKYGTIKEGLVIDHMCRNPSCVNPKHLRQVTNKINILIGMSNPAKNSRKTHCLRGHELSGENLYVQTKTGKRYCKTCDSIRHGVHVEWPKDEQRP